MTLRVAAISQILTTDLAGNASFSFKVPGTFAGLPMGLYEPSSGRNIQKVDIWTVAGTEGDRITNMRVEDTDGVLAAISGNFPNYPVIQYFQDQAADSNLRGFYISASRVLSMTPVSGEAYAYIPSGLYLCADFNTANVVGIGHRVICNITWSVVPS